MYPEVLSGQMPPTDLEAAALLGSGHGAAPAPPRIAAGRLAAVQVRVRARARARVRVRARLTLTLALTLTLTLTPPLTLTLTLTLGRCFRWRA